jgi:hypothetical protein
VKLRDDPNKLSQEDVLDLFENSSRLLIGPVVEPIDHDDAVDLAPLESVEERMFTDFFNGADTRTTNSPIQVQGAKGGSGELPISSASCRNSIELYPPALVALDLPNLE